MSTPTTTIRVTVDTRDRLAAQARERGVSISSLLSDLAARGERDAIFAAERDAERAEANDAAAQDDSRAWDDTTGDGIV